MSCFAGTTMSKPLHIIGACPDGLSAANELAKNGTFAPAALEKSQYLGGLFHTETYDNYHFDIVVH